mmetsp:Transcript_11598/g.25423  ORF Transcript_11598/g.25423 Transcript_11598/m.25423 type:complete len:126 (+) Transcript_11598:88-465(+)
MLAVSGFGIDFGAARCRCLAAACGRGKPCIIAMQISDGIVLMGISLSHHQKESGNALGQRMTPAMVIKGGCGYYPCTSIVDGKPGVFFIHIPSPNSFISPPSLPFIFSSHPQQHSNVKTAGAKIA